PPVQARERSPRRGRGGQGKASPSVHAAAARMPRIGPSGPSCVRSSRPLCQDERAMEGEPASLILGSEASAPRSAPLAQSRRVIWSLAWPVIVTMLSESLVGLVDMLFVSRLGATSVAAVGVGA